MRRGRRSVPGEEGYDVMEGYVGGGGVKGGVRRRRRGAPRRRGSPAEEGCTARGGVRRGRRVPGREGHLYLEAGGRSREV